MARRFRSREREDLDSRLDDGAVPASHVGSPGKSTGSLTRIRWLLVGAGVLFAIAIAMVVSTGPTARPGTQAPSVESISVERAALDGWELLLPVDGELRAGFPPPMVWTGNRVCIGFARVDFGPDDVRPTLARCETNRTQILAPNEIRSVLAIESGFDTWQFIEAADDIDTITVRLASGEAVNDERIHLSGSNAALRLENGRDLASIRWSTGSDTYRCVPEPNAWQTSEFCSIPE